MKWQRNPESLPFGIFIYKRKNTDTPIILTLDVYNEMPTDTRGWWLGPLERRTELEGDSYPCICIHCKAWVQKGSSTKGICHKHPPVDNNWSVTSSTEFCFEFIPKIPEEALYA